MFDAIASRYDLLNTVLSAGVDRYWRWRAVRSLRLTGRETAVDLCTGTADLVVARAGATSIAELTALGAACVLVPYPYATDDHQTGNARFLADAGAAVLLPQDEMTPARLASLIAGMSRLRLLEMAVSARRQARPEATRTVAAARVCAAKS